MTLPYLLRLLLLSLATFGAVNIVATVAIRCLSNRILARAERMQAGRAARSLLFWRLFPANFAIFCVIGLCVPSYLWLEPNANSEAAGFVCLTAAMLGIAMCVTSFSRSIQAIIQTRGLLRRKPTGRLVALTGILRARVVISDEVIATLSPREFDIAMRHELAHRASHDNLKKFLILLSPGFLLNDMEGAWKKFSEWAADDLASAGDSDRAADLASALVSVARLRPATAPILATTLLDDDAALSARVDRLLDPPPAPAEPSHRLIWITFATFVVGAPFALPWVHNLLERLMD
jgi:Zn-dependent protease with chaperone function